MGRQLPAWFEFKLMAFVVAGCLSGVPLEGCGPSGAQTCLSLELTYKGSRLGDGYAIVQSGDGGRAFFTGLHAQSIKEVSDTYRGLALCSSAGVDPGDLLLDATAWIDVSSSAALRCGDIRSANCKPAAGDPVGTKKVVLRFRQSTTVTLEVVDSP